MDHNNPTFNDGKLDDSIVSISKTIGNYRYRILMVLKEEF